MNDEKLKKSIIKILIVFSSAFMLLIGYLSYFVVFQGQSIVSRPDNKRLKDKENQVLRGSIYDRNMNSIAQSQRLSDNTQKRVYREGYSQPYAAILGYCSNIYGSSGLESKYASTLMDSNMANPLKVFKDVISGSEVKGNNLVLTTDSELTKTAYDALGDNRGAVVALNPGTGEVLAMVSKPVFNPATIDADWNTLIKQNDAGPFINRATQPRMYPPGSTFKVIVASEALEHIPDIESRIFYCKGNLKIGNYTLSDFGNESHGKINMKEALTVSCNITFGTIGMELGADTLKAGAEDFMFNKTVDYFDLPVNESKFPTISKDRKDSLAQSSIGQYEVTVTPFEMALVASTIANGGTMMKPYLIKSVKDSYGDVISTTKPSVLAKPIKPETAEKVKEMMIDVVKKGTGKSSKISGIEVAGKTGTAEVGKNVPAHSWFIAFAPADNPQIAVSVIIENGETGGGKAAAAAKKIIEEYLKK